MPAKGRAQAVGLDRLLAVPGKRHDLDARIPGGVGEETRRSDDRRFAAAPDLTLEQANPLPPRAARDQVVEQAADGAHSELAGLGHALG